MVSTSSVAPTAQDERVAPRARGATLRRWLGFTVVCAVATAPMLAYAVWRLA